MEFQQAEEQMRALGENLYEIAKMRWNERENRTMSIDDTLTVEKIKERAGRYALDVINGENLYIRARPDALHPIIFIDDNTPAGAEFLRGQGITPACVVQTSIDDDGVPRLHCWYRMPSPLDCPTRKAVEKIIINRLHEKFPHPNPKKRPGDVGSNDGQHRGRLAGTWNHGLGKERDCPVMLIEASGHVLSDAVAAHLLEEAAPFIDYSPKRKPDASLEEIRDHKYERPSIVDFYLKNVVPKMDPTREHFKQDLFAAGYLLNNGFCEMDIKKVLLLHDPNPIEDRKAGREAWFLENIVQEAQGKKAPSPHPGGGEVLMPFPGGVPAAVPPADQPDPAPSSEPLQEAPYVGQGTGQKMRGTISPDGKITFGVAFADTPTAPETKPQAPATRPAARRQFRLGVKPRGNPARPPAPSFPKP